MPDHKARPVAVLIVEDEAIVAAALQIQLEGLGLRVVGICATGAQAIERARQDPPDLLLLDIRLKGDLDGIEVARALGPGAPVVFLTAYADEETLARAKQVAPLAYLIKPYSTLTLQVTLEMALGSLESRHQREQALLEADRARRLASSIVETSTDAILTIDASQRVVLFNRAAEKVFGYRSTEVVGQPLGMLIDPEMRAHHRALAQDFMDQRLLTARPMNQQRRVLGRRKDGSPVPLQISISRHTVDGQPVSTAIARDVSLMEMLQDELLLRRSLGLAERLASSVAHDMNNVLTVVFNIAYTLRLTRSLDETHELAEHLMEAGLRARSLARRLAPARGGGPQRAKPSSLDLGQAITDMEDLLRQVLGERVRLGLSVCPDCQVEIDQVSFEQILLNLAVNARDAMPDGGELRISLTEERDVAVLAVEDSGVGMSEDVIRQCLEPFFTTRDADGGTGLGLATVHDNVRRWGGQLDIDAREGEGTRFTIRFPALHGATAPAAGQQPPAEPSPSRLDGLLLLYVEDDPHVRTQTARQLERAGAEVLQASGPGQALSLAECHEGRLSGVVTDLHLPYVNGDELVRILRRRRADLPAVVLTARPGEARRALGADTDVRIVAKPFEVHELVSTVAGVCRPRAGAEGQGTGQP